MNAVRSPIRDAIVGFLAREIDEEHLRSSGWVPIGGATRYFASYAGGRRDQPYKMPGPAGSFTRFRGDHPENLYRLDGEGGWALNAAAGKWEPHDAPVRLSLLEDLSGDEVDALYELDDWGSWYFDYEAGNWELAAAPRVSYYLADLAINEVGEAEARRAATALGVADAL